MGIYGGEEGIRTHGTLQLEIETAMEWLRDREQSNGMIRLWTGGLGHLERMHGHRQCCRADAIHRSDNDQEEERFDKGATS
jgi:hypothetical protein